MPIFEKFCVYLAHFEKYICFSSILLCAWKRRRKLWVSKINRTQNKIAAHCLFCRSIFGRKPSCTADFLLLRYVLFFWLCSACSRYNFFLLAIVKIACCLSFCFRQTKKGLLTFCNARLSCFSPLFLGSCCSTTVTEAHKASEHRIIWFISFSFYFFSMFFLRI